MRKSKVIETLESLPEEFNIEELVEKLVFEEKVEQGLRDITEGEILTLEEAKERMRSKWERKVDLAESAYRRNRINSW